MASHAPAPSHTARRWPASTAAPAYRPALAVYRPRRPTGTPLYPIVQHQETFLAEAQDADPMGWGVPSRVERDFRDHASRGAHLRCDIRLRCRPRQFCVRASAARRIGCFECESGTPLKVWSRSSRRNPWAASWCFPLSGPVSSSVWGGPHVERPTPAQARGLLGGAHPVIP
jgi:hypothetical protein